MIAMSDVVFIGFTHTVVTQPIRFKVFGQWKYKTRRCVLPTFFRVREHLEPGQLVPIAPMTCPDNFIEIDILNALLPDIVGIGIKELNHLIGPFGNWLPRKQTGIAFFGRFVIQHQAMRFLRFNSKKQ